MVLLGQPPVFVSTYIEGNDKSLSEVEQSKSDSHNASFNHLLMTLVFISAKLLMLI